MHTLTILTHFKQNLKELIVTESVAIYCVSMLPSITDGSRLVSKMAKNILGCIADLLKFVFILGSGGFILVTMKLLYSGCTSYCMVEIYQPAWHSN
jgi:choline-glycine betaine transporter